MRFDREKSATLFPLATLGIVELVSTENIISYFIQIFFECTYSEPRIIACAHRITIVRLLYVHYIQQIHTQYSRNVHNQSNINTLLGALKFALSLAELVIIQKAWGMQMNNVLFRLLFTIVEI